MEKKFSILFIGVETESWVDFEVGCVDYLAEQVLTY